MSIARNLAALLDSSGDVVAGALDNAGGGGGWTEIGTTTVTSVVNSVAFTGVPSSYNFIRLVCHDIDTVYNLASSWKIQVTRDGGTSWSNSIGTSTNSSMLENIARYGAGTYKGDDQMWLKTFAGYTTTNPWSFVVDFTLTDDFISYMGYSVLRDDSSDHSRSILAGHGKQTSRPNGYGIVAQFSSGDCNSGLFTLYGM